MKARLRLIVSATPLCIAALLMAAAVVCSLVAIARGDDKPPAATAPPIPHCEAQDGDQGRADSDCRRKTFGPGRFSNRSAPHVAAELHRLPQQRESGKPPRAGNAAVDPQRGRYRPGRRARSRAAIACCCTFDAISTTTTMPPDNNVKALAGSPPTLGLIKLWIDQGADRTSDHRDPGALRGKSRRCRRSSRFWRWLFHGRRRIGRLRRETAKFLSARPTSGDWSSRLVDPALAGNPAAVGPALLTWIWFNRWHFSRRAISWRRADSAK